jgi:WD40 repeat protein
VAEAQAWVELGLHPHTVSCFYVRTLGGVPRVFAEWVDGGSLAEAIESGRLYAGPDPLATVADIAIQFAWGLAHAHDRGLIHQDVKPANVMLTRGGQVKVTDFGLTRAATAAPDQPDTTTGGTVLTPAGGYTPAYASPEQLRRAPTLSRRTDTYSYGLSVLTMLTGGCDWPLATVGAEQLARLLDGSRRSAVGPIPRDLADLLAACLAADGCDRPHTMTQVADALTAVYALHAGRPHPRSRPAAADLLAATLNNRALSLLDLGQEAAASAVLDEAVGLDPGQTEVVYNRAMLRWELGALSDRDAVAELRSLTEAAPDRWQAWVHLADVNRRRRDPQGTAQALAAARTAGAPPEELGRFGADGAATTDLDRRRRLADGGAPVRQVEFVDAAVVLAVRMDGTTQAWELGDGTDRPGYEVPRGLLTTPRPSQLPCGPPTYLRRTGTFVVPRSDGSFLTWYPRTGGTSTVEVFEGPSPVHHDEETATTPFGQERSRRRRRVIGPETVEVGPNRLASAAADGRVRVWDPRGRRPAVAMTVAAADLAPNLAASGDGSRLAAADGRGDVTVWDLRARDGGSDAVALHLGAAVLDEVPAPEYARVAIRRLAISPDGERLLVQVHHVAIGIWELASGDPQRTLAGHGSNVSAVAAFPGGRYVAAAGFDGAVSLWDLDAGTCLRTVTLPHGYAHTLTVSADDRQLAAGTSDGEVYAWDLADLGALPPVPRAIAVPELAESLLEARSRVDELVEACDRHVAARAWGRAAACLEEARAVDGYERHPELLERWRQVGRHRVPHGLRDAWQVTEIHAHTDQVHALAIDPQATTLASGGADGDLHLWELTTGRRLASRPRAHGGGNIVCLAYDPSSGSLVSGGFDGHVRLWDPVTLEPRGGWLVHGAGIHGVRFAPDGSVLAVAAVKGLTVTYTPSGRRVAKRSLLGRHLYSVDVAPDGETIAVAASDGAWYLLDAASLRVLGRVPGHDGNVFCAVFGPDGQQVLSAGQDRTLRVWDVHTGRCLRTLEGHDDMVLECRFTRDGRHAASVAWDGTLRLWRLGAPEPLRTFTAHPGQVQAMAISADAFSLATGGWDERVRVWLLDWDLDGRANGEA